MSLLRKGILVSGGQVFGIALNMLAGILFARTLGSEGTSAVVVPEHDDGEAIAQGLLRVLKNPAERARLAEGARRRGHELKTWEERMRLKIEEVEQVLRAHGNV